MKSQFRTDGDDHDAKNKKGPNWKETSNKYKI